MKKWLVIFAAGFLTVLISIYSAHSNNFCISQWRKVPEKEIFLEAMVGTKILKTGYTSGGYINPGSDIENLRFISVREQAGDKYEDYILYDAERASGFNFKKWIYGLQQTAKRRLEDPEYVKKCCSFVSLDSLSADDREAHTRVHHTFFHILMGKRATFVRIRMDSVVANATSFSPRPNISDNGYDRIWRKVQADTKIVGPTHINKIKYYYADVNVCGKKEYYYN